MDVEELTKSQLIMLSLLVSFVTSMTTGIVTFALMDQAPPAIAQTVNRVIEHTVEKIITPAPAQSASAIVPVKTIVVNEADQISGAVAKASTSIVRIYDTAPDPSFLSVGVAINDAGQILTDGSAFTDITNVILLLPDGSRVHASVTSRDATAGTVTLTAATTTTEGKIPAWTAGLFATPQVSLGSSVIAIMGKSTPRIGSGIVTIAASTSNDKATHIDTSVNSDTIVPGTVLIDMKGQVIGMSTGVSRADDAAAFITVSQLTQPPKTKETPITK